MKDAQPGLFPPPRLLAPALPLPAREEPAPAAGDAAREHAERAARAWRAFHNANPQVWDLFERFALELVAAGRRHAGARMIWERMRWEILLTTRGDVEFKLNDHWPPFYARLFLEQHPELGDFFETRTALADAAPPGAIA